MSLRSFSDSSTLLRSGPGHHPVDGLLQRGHGDQRAVVPRGEQRALVDHVGQVRAGEAGRPPGDHVEVHVGGERLAARVHPQDAAPPGQVRLGHHDLPVEPARPQQRRVQDVRPVGGRDDDHPALDVEAVQLDQQLVQGLLTLVVAAAEAGPAVPADRVDLVHEHDRRGVRLGLLEQVAHPGGADADEHLDEVRPGDRVERHARLPGHGTGQQGLTGTGRAVRAGRPWGSWRRSPGTCRGLQELLDLLQFLDGLVSAGHVREGRLRGVLGDELGLGLPEVHHPGAAALHLVQHQEEDQDDHEERQPAQDHAQ